MSDLLNEQLSALLDGELPPEETALLLKRLKREPALAARLARYRLGGEVLRGERVQPRADFALRVSAAVAAEPALPAPVTVRPASVRWLRPVAGLAVAAGVASLAVLVLQQAPGGRAPVASVASLPAPAVVAPTMALAPAAAHPVRATPVDADGAAEPVSYVTPAARPQLDVIPEEALANYVVAHSRFSAPLAGHSVLIHLVADGPRSELPAR
jgi:sigma-E factor negative regulatory protein RseA